MQNYLTQITNYLLAQSWQVAVLVVVIAVASLAVKNKSAHVRYLLWLIVLAKCLVPPLLTVPLAILPQGQQAEPVLTTSVEMPTVTVEAVVDTAVSEPLGTVPSAPVAAPTIAERLAEVTIHQWLAFAWIIGATVFVFIAVIKALRVNSWLRRDRRLLSAEFQTGIENLFSDLGIRAFPKVWLVDGIGQPFVWGLLRGSIYLPSDFSRLDNRENRRSVLVHELSHIMRFDAAVNVLQIIAQAVFWFHPFVWWANKKIRAEREKCCDEMAIARLGAKAKDYSTAIVNTLIVEHELRHPVPSLAVAGPVKNIEDRIKTIMNPGKKFYKRPGMIAVLVVLLLALMAVPTTIALTSQTKSEPELENSISIVGKTEVADFTATLPNGVTVELIAVCENPNKTRQWWRPDGTLLEKTPYDRLENNPYLGGYEFLAELQGPSDAHYSWEIQGATSQATHKPMDKDGKIIEGLSVQVVQLLGDEESADVRVGVAADEWKTNTRYSMSGSLATGFADGGVIFNPPYEAEGETKLVVAHTFGHLPVRVVAVGNDGSLHESLGGARMGVTGMQTLMCRFDLPKTDIREIWFQTREYTWVEFKNVSLKPGYRTKVQVKLDAESESQPLLPVVDTSEPQRFKRLEVGDVAPDFDIETLDSKTLKLSDFRGKYVLLDFWAVWCGPCIREIPHLIDVYEYFGEDKRFVMVGLSLDRDIKTVKEYVSKSGIKWIQGFLGREPTSVKTNYGVRGIPASFLIGPDGRIIAKDLRGGRLKSAIAKSLGVTHKKKTDVQVEGESNIDVLDVEFEPIRKGKNIVRIEVQNKSNTKQTFAVHIQTRSPDYGRQGVGWGRPFFDEVGAHQTKWMRCAFHIQGPITDNTWLRLKFYNPESIEAYDYEKPFKQKRYTGSELEQRKADEGQATPASKIQATAIIEVFEKIQGYIKDEKYEQTWELFAQDYRDAVQINSLEKFKKRMEPRSGFNLFYWEKSEFLALKPGTVFVKDNLLRLKAVYEGQEWTIDFAQEAGQWKIDWIAGYTPRILLWQNWEQHLLPTMEKRSTKHFDIYYYKDSTAEKEIDQIVEQKEKGFAGICQFLDKDSDVRICMVFFEDGKTKQLETGHQGAGWAYGNTIVEVYNEEQKLGPYHETVHILMGSHGNPPALFNEGFATYMSERLGAHGLESLGGGQSSIYQRVRELKSKNEWIPLEELITYTDIGPGWSRPPVAYPEAASFVKYLIDTYGKDKFLQAYKNLKNSDDKTVHQQNIRKLNNIYGQSLQQLEKQWEDTFLPPQRRESAEKIELKNAQVE